MNKRIGDLEFRHIDNKYEIVKWEASNGGYEYCFTLVLFDKGKEGYSIRFIGARPLEYENQDALWAMMKYGDAVLEALFCLEKEM